MQRGELRGNARQQHDKGHHTKGHMAYNTLRPYGLGCKYLGLHRYACGGNTSVRDHFTLGGITSRPVQPGRG